MTHSSDPSTDARRPWVARGMGLLWRASLGLFLAMAFTHVTVRDRLPLVSVLFYASPLAILGLAAFTLAASGWVLRRSLRACGLLALVGLVALMLAGTRDYRRPASLSADTPSEPVRPIRLLFWNVGRGWFSDWESIAQELKRFDADVIALVEATGDEVQETAFWRKNLPGYTPRTLGDGAVLLARGEIEEGEQGSLAWRGMFRESRVDLAQSRFQVVIADVESNPLLSRRDPLARLRERMTNWEHEPALVVGDFNTPPSSVFFDTWRDTWRQSWETAGTGYQPTWPLPVPVHPLDQIWGNRRIRFVRCFADWTQRSDHRPLIVEFRVEGLKP